MSRSASVAVLIPARDEEASLPGVLGALGEADPGRGFRLATVVVVDNGSTDATARVASRAGTAVVREPRKGYGRACLRGIAALAGLGSPPDILVFLDADDDLAPGQLRTLLTPLREEEADLVIGERHYPRGEGVRIHALLGNRGVSWVLRGVYASTTRDLGPFRAIRWAALRELALDDRTFGWYVQMQIRALKAGFRVVGVPVAFRRRTRGRSKVSGSLRASLVAGRVILRTLAAEIVRPGRE
ncbi:MAG: glycosyltransferase family 2 protein [Gemmatimonadota bacterium]